MTVKQVEQILEGRFADEADRKYWEDKLEELKQKEARAEENQRYFTVMIAYDR